MIEAAIYFSSIYQRSTIVYVYIITLSSDLLISPDSGFIGGQCYCHTHTHSSISHRQIPHALIFGLFQKRGKKRRSPKNEKQPAFKKTKKAKIKFKKGKLLCLKSLPSKSTLICVVYHIIVVAIVVLMSVCHSNRQSWRLSLSIIVVVLVGVQFIS